VFVAREDFGKWKANKYSVIVNSDWRITATGTWHFFAMPLLLLSGRQTPIAIHSKKTKKKQKPHKIKIKITNKPHQCYHGQEEKQKLTE
jgi:hypothetical protein